MAPTTDLASIPEKLRHLLSHHAASTRLARAQPRDQSSDAYRLLAPQYAYGRHRGPAPKSAHPAAVLIALVSDNQGGWTIPLTLRPPQMVDHAGQISLPGGRAEDGEMVWLTASREFGEELGCATDSLQPIGQLRPLYVYASRHQVIPMVGLCSSRPIFNPNPDEVAELIYFPLERLIAEDSIVCGTMQRGMSRFDAPGFRIDDHFVWGATAMILGEFRQWVCSLFSDTPHSQWVP